MGAGDGNDDAGCEIEYIPGVGVGGSNDRGVVDEEDVDGRYEDLPATPRSPSVMYIDSSMYRGSADENIERGGPGIKSAVLGAYAVGFGLVVTDRVRRNWTSMCPENPLSFLDSMLS